MQDKAIIIMEPEEADSSERACLYLEHSVFGIVSLINMFNMESDLDYQLYLLDDDGGSVTETISSNYKMFKLPNNFSLKRDMYAELYVGDRLILSGKKSARPKLLNNHYEPAGEDFFLSTRLDGPVSAKEWANETGQERLYEEALNVIEKYKKSPSSLIDKKETHDDILYENITKTNQNEGRKAFNNNETTICVRNQEFLQTETSEGDFVYNFYDIIGTDFETMFEAGKREEVLEGVFKNSLWSKVLIEERHICLGKIYKEADYNYGAMPDIVALAVPTVAEKQSKIALGRHSSIVRVTPSNDFGFMVLLQDAKTGKAIKIIKNKG